MISDINYDLIDYFDHKDIALLLLVPFSNKYGDSKNTAKLSSFVGCSLSIRDLGILKWRKFRYGETALHD